MAIFAWFKINPANSTGRGRKLSSASVAGTETSVYLQDLRPGTEYSGHIVSQNDVGLSGPSVAMHFITEEEGTKLALLNTL